MTTNPTSGPRAHRRGWLALGALAATGVIAGGVLAGAASASADTTPSSTASDTAGQGGTIAGSGGAGAPAHAHGSTPVRADEKALSAADADKVTAAAEKAVSGGTVYRVETDAGDGAYEAHMTKSAGTEVTVKLDESFAVIGVEDGMGTGDPAPPGAPGGEQGSPAGSGGSGEVTSPSAAASD